MKVSNKLFVPAFLAALLLAGCGQQDVAAPVEDAMESATEMATDAAEAATDAAAEVASDAAEAVEEAVSDEPGGYVPTADELIPGETRP